MAVIALPHRKSNHTGDWLGNLCLRYVNWCAGKSRLRSLTMRLSPEALMEWESGTAENGLTIDDLRLSGGVRSLLRLYNQAYVGAPDYRRAGWPHAKALQTTNGFDPSLVWIVRRNGRPVAFCMARLLDGCGRITGLGVLPEARRQGIGTMVMRHAVGELKRRGAQSVSLSVCETNETSIRVYFRLGFRVE